MGAHNSIHKIPNVGCGVGEGPIRPHNPQIHMAATSPVRDLNHPIWPTERIEIMTDDELIHQLMKARCDFAAAVMAFHKASCDDDALLDRMSKCERAYLDIIFTSAAPGLAAAIARNEQDIDQLRKLLAIPPEGEA